MFSLESYRQNVCDGKIAESELAALPDEIKEKII